MRKLKFDISTKRIRRVDRKKIYEVYRSWPSLAEEGSRARVDLPMEGYPRAVYFGMGGSSAAGDLIADWLRLGNRARVAFEKGLPNDASMKGALVIACSVSGNTKETLEAAKLAMKRGGRVVTISAGGLLKDFASVNGLTHIAVPHVIAPRFALPFLFFALLRVCETALGLRSIEKEVKAALAPLSSLANRIDISNPTKRNPSKRLALDLWDSIPKIYGSTITRGVALRFKNALNENAKMHAFADSAPDLFHNEVEAWEGCHDQFVGVFLRHVEESASDTRRFGAMVKMLRELGAKVVEERGVGTTALSQIFTLTYVLDVASYYVAVANGRDPYPTKLLDELKRKA